MCRNGLPRQSLSATFPALGRTVRSVPPSCQYAADLGGEIYSAGVFQLRLATAMRRFARVFLAPILASVTASCFSLAQRKRLSLRLRTARSSTGVRDTPR